MLMIKYFFIISFQKALPKALQKFLSKAPKNLSSQFPVIFLVCNINEKNLKTDFDDDEQCRKCRKANTEVISCEVFYALLRKS